MTDYAVDIASYQAGLNLSEVRNEGFPALFVKCTDGVGYVNPYYAGWMAQRAIFSAFVPYHYLEAGDSAASQVQFFQAHVGFASKWAMIDVESGSGNAVQVRAAVQAFKGAGYKVALYLPKWYWQEIGSPDMSGWGIDLLIASGYPGGTGTASALYAQGGGDGSSQWAAYGGVTPGVWQFTDRASVAGQSVDANALKAGILAQLGGSGGSATTPLPPVTTIIASPATHNVFTPLSVDGDFGTSTVKAVQLVIYAGHVALATGVWDQGARVCLQQHLGLTGSAADGVIGKVSTTALQNKLKAAGFAITVDGDWGAQTTEVLQTALNEGKFS